MNWHDIEILLACPACKFDPESKVTLAANAAVGFMLVLLVGVLGSFIALIVKLARGERLALQESEQGRD